MKSGLGVGSLWGYVITAAFSAGLGLIVAWGGKVAPQRTERYHRAQMMSINFVPGHARPKAGWAVVYIRCGVAGMGLVLGRSGLVLAWSVLSFSALSWSLLSKLKI